MTVKELIAKLSELPEEQKEFRVICERDSPIGGNYAQFNCRDMYIMDKYDCVVIGVKRK